nr:hypothetical protein [Tanacetum cinerariifolium]
MLKEYSKEIGVERCRDDTRNTTAKKKKVLCKKGRLDFEAQKEEPVV